MRKLGIVAIVLIGLWTIVLAFAQAINKAWTAPEALGSLIFSAGLLAFGILLIFGRNWLADRWFQDSSLGASIDAISILRVGFVLIGVYLIASAIPVLSGVVLAGFYVAIAQDSQPMNYFGYDPFIWEGIVRGSSSGIVSLGFGLLLIKRSAPLADRLWSGRKVKERTASISPACPSCGTPYDPADYSPDAAEPWCFTCHKPLDLSSEAWNDKGLALEEEGRHEEAWITLIRL